MLLYVCLGSIIIGIICLAICLLTQGHEYRPASSGSAGSGGPITYNYAGGTITDLMGDYHGGTPARKERKEKKMIKAVWYPSYIIFCICAFTAFFSFCIYCWLADRAS